MTVSFMWDPTRSLLRSDRKVNASGRNKLKQVTVRCYRL
ncbi:Uncharacterised protein [Enterobacter hormaechei]|nr:Uncharacterised protein [Enterobacter hormaechei]VAE27038.1 Uncharacterised protein [Enterobacter hormaechei]